jgi:DNA-binding NtrC family response regulator
VVQAKLLRTLETREVLPIGGNAPRKVDVRLVSATHVDLRRAVGAQKFREDLFFRLSRPMVALPPLRDRPEEIAFLAAAAAARIVPTLTLGAGLVEACLLREWPGNVRELMLEVEDAARRGQVQGQQETLEVEHLDAEAGIRAASEEVSADGTQSRPAPKALPAAELIEAALQESGGRVATAARRLGVHRNQLRRWLEARGQPPAE